MSDELEIEIVPPKPKRAKKPKAPKADASLAYNTLPKQTRSEWTQEEWDELLPETQALFVKMDEWNEANPLRTYEVECDPECDVKVKTFLCCTDEEAIEAAFTTCGMFGAFVCIEPDGTRRPILIEED